MTHLARERCDLLNEYIRATEGKVIDPYGPNAPSAAALAQDYLQFLIGHPIPPVPGDAYQWAGKDAGRVLANLPTDPRTRTEPWATYTPSPLVNPRPHKRAVWPIPGDLIVFDRNARQGNPWGTLGIFLDRDDDRLWSVFTQGFGPPSTLAIDSNYLTPLGWWRVSDTRLLARTKNRRDVNV